VYVVTFAVLVPRRGDVDPASTEVRWDQETRSSEEVDRSPEEDRDERQCRNGQAVECRANKPERITVLFRNKRSDESQRDQDHRESEDRA
jgi:hypothetical protein